MLLLLLFFLSTSSVFGQSIDTGFYYRLMNPACGLILSVTADGTGLEMLRPSGLENQLQEWQFQRLSSGPYNYALSPSYLGTAFRLDILPNEMIPVMSPTGLNLSEQWTVMASPIGGIVLKNAYLVPPAPQLHLDVDPARNWTPYLSWADSSPSRTWIMLKSGRIADPTPIPQLRVPPQSVTWYTEGATNYSIFLRPNGQINAILLFVKFDKDPQPPPGEAEQIAKTLLDGNTVSQFYSDQSHTEIQLYTNTHLPQQGQPWKSINNRFYRPVWNESIPHQEYVRAVVAAFADEVDFSQYQIVLIAASKASITNTAALIFPPNSQPPESVSHFATFGNDAFDAQPFKHAAHEIGHSFGLPDLYTSATAIDWPVGGWDIMSDVFTAQAQFLAWTRYKLGWIANDRYEFYSPTPPELLDVRGTLNPLTGEYGTVMVVVELVNRTRLLVLQVAPPLPGATGDAANGGLLVYTVDTMALNTNVDTDYRISVITTRPEYSPIWGNRYRAPVAVGETLNFHDSGYNITVVVDLKICASYYYRTAVAWVGALDGITDQAGGGEQITFHSP